MVELFDHLQIHLENGGHIRIRAVGQNPWDLIFSGLNGVNYEHHYGWDDAHKSLMNFCEVDSKTNVLFCPACGLRILLPKDEFYTVKHLFDKLDTVRPKRVT